MSEIKYIFCVTTMTYDEINQITKNHSIPGVFDCLESAATAVATNSGDIHETSYEYAVIEKIQINRLYSYDSNPKWYKWNKKSYKYEPIEMPEFAKGIVGWGIG